MFYQILIPVIAGITGTTFMTIAILLVKRITGRQINVIRILGTMLTASTTADGGCSRRLGSMATGVVGHYAVGIIFSFVYMYLWKHQLIGTDWITTSILGFVTGLTGIITWSIYFRVHAHPPHVPLKLYLSCILSAHILFAWGARWVIMNGPF